MAANKGDIRAMHKLGNYYYRINNCEEMEKYYLMAANKGDSNSMNNLGKYYQKINDLNLMKKYYLMSIEKGNDNAIWTLLTYYINNIQNDIYDDYFFKFLNIKNEKLQNKLPINFKVIKKLYNGKLDLLEVHFKYSETGKGFEEAKKDFINLLKI